jgi:hypothetical protein
LQPVLVAEMCSFYEHSLKSENYFKLIWVLEPDVFNCSSTRFSFFHLEDFERNYLISG